MEHLSRYEKTGVLLIAPETAQLPDTMGPLARYISSKSGGLGDVVAALCRGLADSGIDCHLATLCLKRRFQKECGLDEASWQDLIHRIDPERIHLVNSSFFSHLSNAYEGNSQQNAAEFQKQVVNHIITEVRAKHRGKLIIHSHDWMAGGVITAFARMRGFPILHTVHNIHTGEMPLEMLSGLELEPLLPYLYFTGDHGHVDNQATAIKNADLVSFVSPQFLQEMVNGHFSGESIFGSHIRREIKIKYDHGATLAVMNAPSPSLYPENCRHLPVRFGPVGDVLEAKRQNLMEFQRRTGLLVDPEAILFYWPSRLDSSQKGIHLLEEIAHHFVIAHWDAQIAIVGNGIGPDRIHEEYCGRIAWSSGGKITYHRFNEALSLLGFAAASDVFGASLYEPCGQIDLMGNLYGATATNRDTGGYHDKIRELSMTGDGAPEDSGNGFLFRDYDAGGLWNGLRKSIEFHRRPAAVRQTQIKRIMREIRRQSSLDSMVHQYVTAYERLNGGLPLA
jgi:glycogen synthase